MKQIEIERQEQFRPQHELISSPAKSPKNRVRYVDIARGIGMLLVLLGHLPFSQIQINLIYFFHMPLFFYLSGIFHRRRPWREEFERAFWSWLSILFYGVLFVGLSALLLGREHLLQISKLLTLAPDIYAIPFYGLFWFLVALVVVRLAARALPARRFLWLGVAFFFLWKLADEATHGAIGVLPFCVGPACLLLVFYQAGAFNDEVKHIYSPRRLCLLSLNYLVVAMIFIASYGGALDKITNYHHMQLFQPAAAFCIAIEGIIITIWLSLWLAQSAVWRRPADTLAFVGKYTFHFFTWQLAGFQLFYWLKEVTAIPMGEKRTLTGEFVMAVALSLLSIFIYRRFGRYLPEPLSRLLYLR